MKCTHCGAVIKSAKDVPAGAKVKCPKCAKVFVAQPESAAAQSAGPPAPADDNPFSTMGPGDPDSLERHKPKKSGPLKIVLGCGCLLLLTCCCGFTGGGYYFKTQLETAIKNLTKENEGKAGPKEDGDGDAKVVPEPKKKGAK